MSASRFLHDHWCYIPRQLQQTSNEWDGFFDRPNLEDDAVVQAIKLCLDVVGPYLDKFVVNAISSRWKYILTWSALCALYLSGSAWPHPLTVWIRSDLLFLSLSWCVMLQHVLISSDTSRFLNPKRVRCPVCWATYLILISWCTIFIPGSTSSSILSSTMQTSILSFRRCVKPRLSSPVWLHDEPFVSFRKSVISLVELILH